MARLTTMARKNLPKSEFLGPGRTFPGEDKTHLRKAIQLAPRSEHAGNISAGTEKSIVRKAKDRLGDGDDRSHKRRSVPRGGAH